MPGLDREITVQTCIYCGGQTQSEYLDSTKKYTVTVSEGRNHIWGNNWSYLPWDIESMYAGQILEITTPIPESGTMRMLVNGENIPVLWTKDGKQTFGFIMPEANVELRIFVEEANTEE